MTEVAFIQNGKLFRVTAGGEPIPVESAFANQVSEREAQIRRKTEWKKNTARPGSCGPYNQNCEENCITANFSSVSVNPHSQELHYALYTDTIGGVFAAASTERRILHTNQYRPGFLAFEPKGDRTACAVEHVDGSSNLGLIDGKTGRITTLTEGDAVDTAPAWHPTRENCLIYQSTGIARSEYGDIQLFAPAALRLLNLKDSSIETILEDEKFDFLTPRFGPDGTLYYLRRPYQKHDQSSLLKKLEDAFMAPFRLIRAIYARLNFFSLMYTGKPLTSAGGSAIERSNARKVAIWGNLLEADAAARFPGLHSETVPSMVPSSWQLVAQDSSGKTTTLSDGVLSFDIGPKGTIVISNGSTAYVLSKEGVRTRLASGRVIQSVAVLKE
jgi:hypothetical protein